MKITAILCIWVVALSLLYLLGRQWATLRRSRPVQETPFPSTVQLGDVVIDLQAIFDQYYDAGPYKHISPYTESTLEPPLPPEQAAPCFRQPPL